MIETVCEGTVVGLQLCTELLLPQLLSCDSHEATAHTHTYTHITTFIHVFNRPVSATASYPLNSFILHYMCEDCV